MLERQLEGTDFEILPSLDLLCGRDRYVPDLVVAAKNAQYTDDMLDGASSLAVEIMSPGQTIGRLFEKCDVYVRHGTSNSPSRLVAALNHRQLLDWQTVEHLDHISQHLRTDSRIHPHPENLVHDEVGVLERTHRAVFNALVSGLPQ